MFLLIVGTGDMGKTVEKCAKEDGGFHKIELVEPLAGNWPAEKADLIIDFSNPRAMKGIYEYCRGMGGGIPVVIGTTGQRAEGEAMITLLEKICPVVRKANFSRGISAMLALAAECGKLLPESEAAVAEIHHNKKKDAPSGTAGELCAALGLAEQSAVSMRIGNVCGRHSIYFALEDETLEITHTAYSKRIFALGAIEEGKALVEKTRKR